MPPTYRRTGRLQATSLLDFDHAHSERPPVDEAGFIGLESLPGAGGSQCRKPSSVFATIGEFHLGYHVEIQIFRADIGRISNHEEISAISTGRGRHFGDECRVASLIVGAKFFSTHPRLTLQESKYLEHSRAS